MTDPPLFSRLDADRILRRAAEIEGSEDAKRLTVEEVRFIVGEVGFGPRAIDRAIAEAQEARRPGAHRPPVQRWGLLFTHLSIVRQVPVEIDSEQLMTAVRLFQPYREGPAHVKLEEHEITWRDRKGLRFAVSSGGGITEIRISVAKFLIRRGRWMGWVKTAADRLEMLISLVAEEGSGGSEAARPSLPSTASSRPSEARR